MGKTRTAFIEGGPDKNSGKKKYEKKKKAVVGKMGLKGGERIKVVGAEPADEPKKEVDTKTKESSYSKKKTAIKTKTRSLKYQDSQAKVDPNKHYSLKEAIKLVKETSYSSFNGTVELHLVVKKTGLAVNVTLPHTSGKTKKVEVADEKTIENLEKGKVNFDVLLATPDMMPKLVPFARILGPKGLMPNPKNKTIIKSKSEASKFSTDAITLKTERKAPLIHTTIGKVDQKLSELEENLTSMLDAIGQRQIVKGYLKATMGPSIKLSLS